MTYLAIDQGTTSSRSVVFSDDFQPQHIFTETFEQIYPNDGWVEHNPEDIFNTVVSVCKKSLTASGVVPKAIGITNQRETVVLWNKTTGKPIYNAIVWQDRRTAKLMDSLKEQGLEKMISEKSGLLCDPYFSASKIQWILDNVDGARQQAMAGNIAFGTIDTFLIWRLTGGRQHLTDSTNASRTLLFNIHTKQWDTDLLDLFNIPESILPVVQPATADYGITDVNTIGHAIPILAVLGDQHSAMVGQGCFNMGTVKSTYGTGCFMLANVGYRPVLSTNRLLSTLAYETIDETVYALEGSIFNAGSAIKWLRDTMGLIKDTTEVDILCRGRDSNNGVYVVPAFTGLGAPHWDADARGAIYGLTRDSDRVDIVRATVESIAYQSNDLLNSMRADGISISGMRVDGGVTNSAWLMQYLSDILQCEIDKPDNVEATAGGVAYLAGLMDGYFSSINDVSMLNRMAEQYTPQMDNSMREKVLSEWHVAINRTLRS